MFLSLQLYLKFTRVLKCRSGFPYVYYNGSFSLLTSNINRLSIWVMLCATLGSNLISCLSRNTFSKISVFLFRFDKRHRETLRLENHLCAPFKQIHWLLSPNCSFSYLPNSIAASLIVEHINNFRHLKC